MTSIVYRNEGTSAIVELNRPQKLNAINGGMRDAFCEALDTAAGDKKVHVLQIRGRGRAFSAGFDLDMGDPEPGVEKNQFVRDELTKDFDLIMRIWDFPKPVIAAVHGYCLGSAVEISAVCDITVASDDCRFGVPEVRHGSGIVCLILPWIVGQKNAREMLLTGSDSISAERALSMGLVNRVVHADELVAVSNRIAEEIALNDPLAVRLTKQALNQSVEVAGLRRALLRALETDIEIETADSPHAREFNRIFEEQGLKAALAWRSAKNREKSDTSD